MFLYSKITFRQHLKNQADIIGLLLHYLPFCKTPEQRDAVMQEIRNTRKEVMQIEEMTKTEKKRLVKWKVITIESNIN